MLKAGYTLIISATRGLRVLFSAVVVDVAEDQRRATVRPMRQGSRLTLRSALKVTFRRALPRSPIARTPLWALLKCCCMPVLYDYAERQADAAGARALDLVVVRSGQGVFTEIVQDYLRRIAVPTW
jgi:hypothetical protein